MSEDLDNLPAQVKVLLVTSKQLLQSVVGLCLRSAFLKTINYCQSHYLAGYEPVQGTLQQRLEAVANRAHDFYYTITACQNQLEKAVKDWCWVRRRLSPVCRALRCEP